MTRRFIEGLRKLLLQAGYSVSQVGVGALRPPVDYLTGLEARGVVFERILAWDRDSETLHLLMELFPEREVLLHAAPEEEIPGGRCLIEAGAARVRMNEGESPLPGIALADVVLVRCQLHELISGRIDLAGIVARLSKAGLRLHDVLQLAPVPLGSTGLANVFLAFEREGRIRDEAPRAEKGRARRVSEALSLLARPLLDSSMLTALTERGSFGFAAGIFNPGAIEQGSAMLLLARGERDAWPVQKRDHARFFSSASPVLLRLSPDGRIEAGAEVEVAEATDAPRVRREDFRLFGHAGRVYANHSVIEAESGNTQPETLPTRVGLALLEPESGRLEPLGFPEIDRPVGRVEKNWAMFSADGEVHLIYSFHPYRLFTAPAFPEMRFRLSREREFRVPMADDGLAFRNSINPVPYDDAHFLHIVHKVYPCKRYVFWAVLLARDTLLPVKFSRRPLLSAAPSAGAAVAYASSAIGRPGEVLIFGGIDDCAAGLWRLPRPDLDRAWIPLE